MNNMKCVLCSSTQTEEVVHQAWSDKVFQHCLFCDLIFLPSEYHVNINQEKDRYNLHNNELDEGYASFLGQLLGPVFTQIQAGTLSTVGGLLDYGCGPTQALCSLVQGQGYACDAYDPFFWPQFPQKQYDLVFSTEVVEHFRQPLQEWQKMLSVLTERGAVAIMTQFHPGADQFSNWWYAKDFTHVSFYSKQTLLWIGSFFQLRPLYLKAPVAILKK